MSKSVCADDKYKILLFSVVRDEFHMLEDDDREISIELNGVLPEIELGFSCICIEYIYVECRFLNEAIEIASMRE
jgi:hypothetical protein